MNKSLLKYWQTQYVLAILAIFSGYAFTFIFGYRLSSQHITSCFFKNITGYPCPGCGMGRATFLLFHGDVPGSLYIHPFALPFLIALLASVIWMAIDLYKGRPVFGSFIKKKMPPPLLIAFFVLVLINWVWSISKGL